MCSASIAKYRSVRNLCENSVACQRRVGDMVELQTEWLLFEVFLFPGTLQIPGYLLVRERQQKGSVLIQHDSRMALVSPFLI